MGLFRFEGIVATARGVVDDDGIRRVLNLTCLEIPIPCPVLWKHDRTIGHVESARRVGDWLVAVMTIDARHWSEWRSIRKGGFGLSAGFNKISRREYNVGESYPQNGRRVKATRKTEVVASIIREVSVTPNPADSHCTVCRWLDDDKPATANKFVHGFAAAPVREFWKKPQRLGKYKRTGRPKPSTPPTGPVLSYR